MRARHEREALFVHVSLSPDATAHAHADVRRVRCITRVASHVCASRTRANWRRRAVLIAFALALAMRRTDQLRIGFWAASTPMEAVA